FLVGGMLVYILFIFISVVFLALIPQELFAHGGHSSATSIENGQWFTFTWSPAVLFTLLLLVVGYWRGWNSLRKKRELKLGIAGSQPIAFSLGAGVIFIALISPIDRLSDFLSSVHMIQHTLLMMVAAPLFVIGSPG